jgi:hypothetical protein
MAGNPASTLIAAPAAPLPEPPLADALPAAPAAPPIPVAPPAPAMAAAAPPAPPAASIPAAPDILGICALPPTAPAPASSLSSGPKPPLQAIPTPASPISNESSERAEPERILLPWVRMRGPIFQVLTALSHTKVTASTRLFGRVPAESTAGFDANQGSAQCRSEAWRNGLAPLERSRRLHSSEEGLEPFLGSLKTTSSVAHCGMFRSRRSN